MAEVPTGLALRKIARCFPARLRNGIRAAPVVAQKEFPPVKAVRYHGRKDIRVENVKEPDGYGPNQSSHCGRAFVERTCMNTSPARS